MYAQTMSGWVDGALLAWMKERYFTMKSNLRETSTPQNNHRLPVTAASVPI